MHAEATNHRAHAHMTSLLTPPESGSVPYAISVIEGSLKNDHCLRIMHSDCEEGSSIDV